MLEPFSASNHNLTIQPTDDSDPPTRSLILSLKVLADDESWREWILNAPPGALDVDLDIPGTGHNLDCWKAEKNLRRLREDRAAAEAAQSYTSRESSPESVKEWTFKREVVKAEERQIKAEPDIY